MWKQLAGSAAVACCQQRSQLDDWETAGRMMEKDVFHEPYRKSLFPDFEQFVKLEVNWSLWDDD